VLVARALEERRALAAGWAATPPAQVVPQGTEEWAGAMAAEPKVATVALAAAASSPAWAEPLGARPEPGGRWAPEATRLAQEES
jgi:hypothetical protein